MPSYDRGLIPSNTYSTVRLLTVRLKSLDALKSRGRHKSSTSKKGLSPDPSAQPIE